MISEGNDAETTTEKKAMQMKVIITNGQGFIMDMICRKFNLFACLQTNKAGIMDRTADFRRDTGKTHKRCYIAQRARFAEVYKCMPRFIEDLKNSDPKYFDQLLEVHPEASEDFEKLLGLLSKA